MFALQTLDLLGHVTPAWLDLLDQSVTHAPRDGPDQRASTVKFSDSAQKATVLNASRMAAAKEEEAIPTWKSI